MRDCNDKFSLFNRFRSVRDKCGVEGSPNSRLIGIPPLVESKEFGSEGPVLESYPRSTQVHLGSLCPDGQLLFLSYSLIHPAFTVEDSGLGEVYFYLGLFLA